MISAMRCVGCGLFYFAGQDRRLSAVRLALAGFPGILCGCELRRLFVVVSQLVYTSCYFLMLVIYDDKSQYVTGSSIVLHEKTKITPHY